MGSPYYKNPPHYEYEVIEKTIDKMFEIIDYIEWTEFSGGEPFLHKDLPKMIAKMMKYESQFDKLLLITNGTIMPIGDLAQQIVANRHKIIIMMSHYGDLSKNADRIAEFCDKNSVELVIKKYYGENQHFGGWVDYGDYHKRGRSECDLMKIYRDCGVTKMQGNFTTHGGQMHWCVPSARGMELIGKIPDNKDEYIDLFDESVTIEQQREKILKMKERKYISACDYCPGSLGTSDVSLRIKAAEQL